MPTQPQTMPHMGEHSTLLPSQAYVQRCVTYDITIENGRHKMLHSDWLMYKYGSMNYQLLGSALQH